MEFNVAGGLAAVEDGLRAGTGRKLCWFAATASLSILLAVTLLPEVILLPAGLCCALAALLTRLLPEILRQRGRLAALGLAFGLLWTAAYNGLCRAPAEALISPERQAMTFTVTDWPGETSVGARIPVKTSLPGAPDPQILLYADAEALALRPGDRVSAEATLRSSASYRGESSDYYPSRGIYLIGYTGAVTLLSRSQHVSPRFWPQMLARALKDSIARLFPADVSGFLAALLTGDKALLPTGLYTAFRRSGIAHVVVISGLHVSFLASLLTVLLGHRRRLSAVLGIALMFFFAAMAGNTPSVLRAAFMHSLLLLAPLVHREEDKPTTLAAALLVVLLPCPYAASSASLQLSFAAVAGIYLLTPSLNGRWLRHLPRLEGLPGRLLRAPLVFLSGTLSTTLGALLFTTPLIAWYFRSVSLAGVLTNLLTLWAVSDTFLLGLAAALLGLFLPGPGQALAWLAAWFARWIIWVAGAVSRLPFAALSLSTIYLIGWFLFAYATVLLCLFFRGRGVRPVIPAAACIITLCAALVMSAWPALTATLRVTALDVGQGASTLFYSKGRCVLVDCGGNSGDSPGDIAADAVQALGTSKLDALVLTHCHSDHANGVAELFTRLDVALLILPDVEPDDPLRREIIALAQSQGCQVELLADDAHFTFGDAEMSLFAPLGDGGVNEAGLSLLCQAGDLRVLLTGDMNRAVEKRLVKYKDLSDIDILLAGHHGSADSSGEELLLATTPEIAVISSGWNSYGHPADETLERLGAAGCDIYLTKDMGTVTFTYQGESAR